MNPKPGPNLLDTPFNAWSVLIHAHDAVWNDRELLLVVRMFACLDLHRASIYVAMENQFKGKVA